MIEDDGTGEALEVSGNPPHLVLRDIPIQAVPSEYRKANGNLGLHGFDSVELLSLNGTNVT
jgi:hypothetical protein